MSSFFSLETADGRDACCSTPLINGEGIFSAAGIDNFMKEVKLADYGLSYAVVSIMGPQSSGKSTLLNHLFHTDFKEMDACEGRTQTTKGIWLARCVGIEPCTLVLDLEGTDGRDRGEDDTLFEKQTALFALAVSDIVLINMWCHDIGREQAANKLLLKTVFQVMMRLFTPRKTTLMFVIRDKTSTPFEKLKLVLQEDIQKIWDSVPKPQAHKETPLSEFFKVEYVHLTSFEYEKEKFKEQVADLRKRFSNSIAPGGLAGDRQAVVPASGFSCSAQEIWNIIKENKDLDLPAHKVMVATVRCEEMANENFGSFLENEEWREIEKAVQSDPVPNFGRKLSSILNIYLSKYDAEATYFDEGVRTGKRKQLEEKLLQLVQPAHQSMLEHIRSDTLKRFKVAFAAALNGGEGFAIAARRYIEVFMRQFDEACAEAVIEEADWDSSKVRDKSKVMDKLKVMGKLRVDLDAHVATVCKTKLEEALAGPVDALLDEADDNTWPEIRELLARETKKSVAGFTDFEMDEEMEEKKRELAAHARGVVESKAKARVGKILMFMKDRFLTSFNHDSDSKPRVWTGKEDIEAITKTAYYSSLKLLSVMAALRLDDEPDNIEITLYHALLDSNTASSIDPLASSSWEEVPVSKTLVAPFQCIFLWDKFKTEIEVIVAQAKSAQEASKEYNKWTGVAREFGKAFAIQVCVYIFSLMRNTYRRNS